MTARNTVTGVEVEVVGLRETMRVLRGVEKTVFFQAVKRIKDAAEPMRKAIADGFPAESPFAGRSRDGWTHNGRTAWRPVKVITKYGGKRKSDGSYPLVRVVVMSAPGQLYDLAGNGNLAEQLGGTPSRVVWPTAKAYEQEVNAALEAAIEEVTRMTNAELERS